MEFPYCKVSNLGLNVTIKGLHHMRILQDFSEQLCYILWNTCEERHIPSEIHYSKKKLYGPFLWIGLNCLKAIETLRGDSLLFTTKSPEIPSNHLSELRRMKVWVEYGVTQYLSRRKINHDYNNNRSFEGIVNVVKLPSYQNSEKAEWEFLIIILINGLWMFWKQ